MKIGIIGAGKMGYTLGKHFSISNYNNIQLVGFYSKNINSAIDAAKFTDSDYFKSIEKLIKTSDVLFLTVPDGEIKNVIEMIDELPHVADGKIICHTSGALSSAEMKIVNSKAYVYSVHPIYAVNSKKESYINFSDAFITIEGDRDYIDVLKSIFSQLGHNVKVISPNDKIKYHSAAVFSSNLVVGLYHMAEELLSQCGFDEFEINCALKPLFINNANKINESNCEDALTGPVERCDIETVDKHLSVLKNEQFEVYKLLSRELINIAANKNKEKNYTVLYELLN